MLGNALSRIAFFPTSLCEVKYTSIKNRDNIDLYSAMSITQQ